MHEGRQWYIFHRGWIASAAKIPTTEEIQTLEHWVLFPGQDLKFPRDYPTGKYFFLYFSWVSTSNARYRLRREIRVPQGPPGPDVSRDPNCGLQCGKTGPPAHLRPAINWTNTKNFMPPHPTAPACGHLGSQTAKLADRGKILGLLTNLSRN